MQDDLADLAGLVANELYFRVKFLWKELGFCLGMQLEFGIRAPADFIVYLVNTVEHSFGPYR